MYAVVRRFEKMSNVEEAGRRAVAGLGPTLRAAAGFEGYYVIDGGDNSGLSITLFDSRENAVKAHEQALGWIKQNLSDLTTSQPQVFSGQVVGHVAPSAAQKSAA